MRKIVIGDISGQKDVSGVLFDFIAKWKHSIYPLDLAAFLQGKNAWDGSFGDNPPKDEEGLLEELRIQLLSGAKSIAQFKLFVKKMNYLSPFDCKYQQITDFYKEVFNIDIRVEGPAARFPQTDNYFIFSEALSIYSNDVWIFKWKEFRQGDRYSHIDSGLSRCEPINYDYGVRPEHFISYDVRSDANSYLLSYEENVTSKDLRNLERFTYVSKNYKPEVATQNSITLREALILSMFEYWKNGRYFKGRRSPKDEKEDKYQIIPCLGSVCKDTDSNGAWPVPIVVLEKDQISSVWASGSGHLPNMDLLKVYQVQEVFTL